MYVSVRTCARTYVCTYVHVRTYVRICLRTYTYVCTCFLGGGVLIYVHEYVRVLAHVRMHLHPHSIFGSIRLSGAVWQRWSRPTIRRYAGT